MGQNIRLIYSNYETLLRLIPLDPGPGISCLNNASEMLKKFSTNCSQVWQVVNILVHSYYTGVVEVSFSGGVIWNDSAQARLAEQDSKLEFVAGVN